MSLRKLAVIRDNDDTPCPFGLSISSACRIAGDSIDQMQVIKDVDDPDTDIIRAQNQKILDNNPEPSKCKYTAHLFKKKPHVVDCNWGESDAGLSQDVAFNGSPYYTNVMDGTGIGGFYSYPPVYENDLAPNRNPYFGINQWASRQERRIRRYATLILWHIR